MQTQQISPYDAEATAAGEQQQGIYTDPEHLEEHADHGSKKKSVLGKVKDKAKKLRTKIKKPKSPGAADNAGSSSASSSEDESGSDGHQQVSAQPGEEREIVSTPGLKGEALEAIPDPHFQNVGGAHGLQERFGQMRVGEDMDQTKLKDEVPSAEGLVSAGVTPYLASHDLAKSPYGTGASRGTPVEEGKNVEDKDLLVTPTLKDDQRTAAMDFEKTPEVAKTVDNTAAWYTPTPESASEATTATTAGAGALDVKSPFGERKNVESMDSDVSRGKKSMLEQAKERIFGSSTKKPEDSHLPATIGDEQIHGDEHKTLTTRAADTVMGFKDTVATKLGYGSSKNPHESEPATMQVDTDDKLVLQKIQESAAGATEAVTSKLGKGEKQQSPSQAEGEGVGTGESKSYTQKAYDAASGAKEAVAAKLGYGGTPKEDSVTDTTNTPTSPHAQKSYLQKMQDTAVGAKDAVASRLGYTNRDLPAAATEGAYNADANVPARTAARFHPGEEDRALSQLITEKMSIGAATVKDTLLRPFGASKSGPPTPTTTPPPSSAAAIAADPVHSTASGTNEVVEGAPYAAAAEEKPGIVGKVTGAVTSLLGTSSSGKKRAEEGAEGAGKAHEDPQAASVCNVEMH